MLDITQIKHDVSEENPDFPVIMVDDRENTLVLVISKNSLIGTNNCIHIERSHGEGEIDVIDSHHLVLFRGEVTLKNKLTKV